MKEKIISTLRESADLKLKFAKDSCDVIEEVAGVIIKCFKADGKVLLFGNGGSASDCQHLASEFVNKLYEQREALPALALTTDSSVITSISNDRSFNNVFSRQLESLASKNDVAIAITTSGKSANILEALNKAKDMGLTTVTFSGKYTKKLKEISDFIIPVPSKSVPRVQEIHITVGHIICELVESAFVEKE